MLIDYTDATTGKTIQVEDAGGRVVYVRSHLSSLWMVSSKEAKAIRDEADRHKCGITIEVHGNKMTRADADLCQPHGYVVYLEVS